MTFGFFDISGSFYQQPKRAGVQSTTYQTGKLGIVTGSLNGRRIRQKNLYNRFITGKAFKYEVGESPYAAYSGSFGVITDPTSYNSELATPPSWTQNLIGKDHAFHIAALSSSKHEVSSLNCFASSSIPLEISSVPASGTLYYSKQSRFITKTYKVTGSIDLLYKITGSMGSRLSGAFGFSGIASAVWPGSYFSAVSGVFLPPAAYMSASYPISDVWKIPITISDYGKIRDIKVWIELVHDGKTNSISSSVLLSDGAPLTIRYGLGTTKIALRNPNVTGFYSIPSWNDQNSAPVLDNSGSFNMKSSQWVNDPYTLQYTNGLQDFYRDSFILWDQTNFNLLPYDGITINWKSLDLKAPVWDMDRNMRTVFSDSAPIFNPRHIDIIFTGSDQSNSGIINLEDYFNTWSTGTEVSISASAPCAVAGAVTGTWWSGSLFNLGKTAWGSQFPWMTDNKLTGLNILASLTGGSPPTGWLSGKGGASNDSEWPTTGSNLGPACIRPVYPLLDKITEISAAPSIRGTTYTHIGVRPGLRGTEIHGTWYLLIKDFANSADLGSLGNGGVWFRQARLEITYDTGIGPTSTNISNFLRFSKKIGKGKARSVRRNILRDTSGYEGGVGQVSYRSGGSISTHHNICMVFVTSEDTYGQFSGITSDTGSTPDFAVFTRLTGALADRLFASASLGPGSGTAHAIWSFLNNENGTPFIPISSGSSIAPAFEFFNTESLSTKSIVSSIINPRPLIPQAHTLKDTVTRLGGASKTSDSIQEKIVSLQKSALE